MQIPSDLCIASPTLSTSSGAVLGLTTIVFVATFLSRFFLPGDSLLLPPTPLSQPDFGLNVYYLAFCSRSRRLRRTSRYLIGRQTGPVASPEAPALSTQSTFPRPSFYEKPAADIVLARFMQ